MELREKHEACKPAKENVLYKIGVFAAMNRVTVKALRFYEDRGLLMPAYINEENGYRFYTLNQMADLHRINALKQAGFTLDEISLMNAGVDENAVLLKKKSEILNEIAELTKKLAIIDGYLVKKQGAIKVPVLVKKIDEVTVAYMEEKIQSYDKLFDLMPKMGELMEEAGCECLDPEYCFTNYLEPGYKDEDILVEICNGVKDVKNEVGNLKYKKMPSIEAACAFHKGSYANFNETYEIILEYIEENGYEIAGPIRESYIDGVWNKEEESEWLTEIQIPVIRRDQ